jgi:hypothetical protein
MKDHSRRGRRASVRAAVCAAVALLLVPLSACSVPDLISDAISQIGNVQKVVQRESSAWRNELAQLQSNLTTLVERQQARATADVKQVLADTTNAVRNLAEETIQLAGLTAEQLIAKFGTELRCNADFARSRVSAGLGLLAGQLSFWQKHKKLPPPPPHSVCQVTPDTVELRNIGEGRSWSISHPRDKVVGVYGYDFRGDATPAVELHDRGGTKLRDTKVSASYVTRYQINLDFGAEDFGQIAPGARYVLRWPDQPEPNAIALSLIEPAELKILGVEFRPAAARAKADLVRLTIDVANQGGSDTGVFTVHWAPGPSDPVQSLSVNNLGPKERRKFTFPGYAYGVSGRIPTDIVLGGGSDSWHGAVTILPFANTPRDQSVHIRGKWPNGGGEPHDPPRDFLLTPIQLGPGCEVDPSRGGGSFQVADINNPSRTSPVSWPAGYTFDFHGDMIWSSMYAVSVNYDASTGLVTPTVTLKGLGGHGIFAVRGPERFEGTFKVHSMCPQ